MFFSPMSKTLEVKPDATKIMEHRYNKSCKTITSRKKNQYPTGEKRNEMKPRHGITSKKFNKNSNKAPPSH